MAKRITIEDHPQLGVGHASIRIRATGLPAEPAGVFFKRPRHAQPDLGPAGWQSGEHALNAEQLAFDGADLLITVGPDVVGYMETGNYQIEIAGAGGAERFTATMRWKNVTPCKPPSASSVAASGLDTARAGKPAAEPPGQEPVSTTQPSTGPATSDSGIGDDSHRDDTHEDEQEETGADPGIGEPPAKPAGNRGILIGAGAAVLLLVVAGVVFFLPGGESSKQAGQEQEREDVVVEGFDRRDWAGRSAEEMYQRGREFMAELDGADNPDELKGYAEWLFDTAKDQGSAEAALALARLYDPRELTPGRAQQLPADLNSAYRAYRQAQELGSTDADTELCGLRAVVEELYGQGDSSARLLLRRPWPECAA